MAWTQSEVNAYLARGLKQKPASSCVEKESELQEAIIAEVRKRGWIVFYSRMDKPTTARIGTPDLIVLGDHGRVWFLECKSRTGKLTSEQLALQAWAHRLSHEVYTIRSLEDFFAVILNPPRTLREGNEGIKGKPQR